MDITIDENSITEDKSNEVINYEAILEIYPILDYVLYFLEDIYLKKVRLVCKLWRKRADMILKARSLIPWIVHYQTESKNLVRKKSLNFYKNNIAALLVCSDERMKHKQLSLDERDKIGNEYINPVDYFMLTCTQIELCLKETFITNIYMAGIFIPNIPNIRSSLIYSTGLERDPDMGQLFTEDIRPDEEVKCIIYFFLAMRNNFYVNEDIEFLFQFNSHQVAFGGGIFDGMHYLKDGTGLFSLNFYKKRNSNPEFNAYSININHEADFETELTRFRSAVTYRRYMFALRICGSRRETGDAETIVIRRAFPNVLLLSVRSEYEIAWECLNVHDNLSPKPELLEVLRMASTTIVLLSWGKQIPPVPPAEYF